MMNYLNPTIFSMMLAASVTANAIGVSPTYFCAGKIQVDVEQDDSGVYYLTPWKNYPTKYEQLPVIFKAIKEGGGGLVIESGRLEQVKDENTKHKFLDQLKKYKFFFNKKANYLELKNTKGSKFLCSDKEFDPAVEKN